MSHLATDSSTRKTQYICLGFLFQARVVGLGVFAPGLGRDVTERWNGTAFPFGGDLEQEGRHQRYADAGHGRVASPVFRIDPPTTVRGPNLTTSRCSRTKNQTRKEIKDCKSKVS